MADGLSLRLFIRGNLARYMDELPREHAKAITGVIRNKTRAVTRAIRRDISRAGLGERLGNAVRGTAYPRRGFSMSAAGTIQSRALVRRDGQTYDLITIFEEGTIISPRNARFLAIPTPEAGTRRTPAEWPAGSLMYRRGRGAPYLVHASRPTVPLFILVRNVRLRARLNTAQIARRNTRNTARLIARAIDRRADRLAQKLGG